MRLISTLLLSLILLLPLAVRAQTSLQAAVSGQLNLGRVLGAAPSFMRFQLVNCNGQSAHATDGTIVNFAPFDVHTNLGSWSTPLYGNDVIVCGQTTGGSAWRITPFLNNLPGPQATYVVAHGTTFVVDNAPRCSPSLTSNCSVDSGLETDLPYMSVVNPGVFTNTQMNEYITSMINGCSTAAMQALFAPGNATNAIAGCLIVPSTATVAFGNAVIGYTQNHKSENASPSTTPSAVTGLCQAAAAGADCLGGIFNVIDTAGIASGILIGVDSTVTALQPAASHGGSALVGYTATAEFKGAGPYPTSTAFQASTDPYTGNQWNTAYRSNDGAAENFAVAGTAFATGVSPSPSQMFGGLARSGGADVFAGIEFDPVAPTGSCPENVTLVINATATSISNLLWGCAPGTNNWTAFWSGGGTSMNVTNPGNFTSAQMNEYVTSVINGCSSATVQAAFGSTSATNAISGCLIVPSTATVQGASAVVGYLQNQKSEASTPSTLPTAVQGLCQANGAGADCLGGNFGVTDTAGTTSGILIGVDSGVTVLQAAASHPSGLIGYSATAEFKGAGPYPNSTAFHLDWDNSQGPLNNWHTGLSSRDGASVLFTDIGTTSLASGASDSQPIQGEARATGTTDTAGQLQFVHAVPTGTCPPLVTLAINVAATSNANQLYGCQPSNVWSPFESGGGAGTGTVLPNNTVAGALANYAAAGGSTTVGPSALADTGTTLTYSGNTVNVVGNGTQGNEAGMIRSGNTQRVIAADLVNSSPTAFLTAASWTSAQIGTNQAWNLDCHLMYQTASTNTHVVVAVNFSQAPTAAALQARVYTDNNGTSTSAYTPNLAVAGTTTIITGGAPAQVNTQFEINLRGGIELGATPSSFAVQFAPSNVGTIAILRLGSFCTLQ